jgi:hypothetical protein
MCHHRIGNKSRPSAGYGGKGKHSCRAPDVTFTATYQTFIAQLMKSQAWISVDVSAIKSSNAVYCDSISSMAAPISSI